MSSTAQLTELDPYWQDVADFLATANAERCIVPDPLDAMLPRSIRPDQLEAETPDEFSAIVVHKGMYTAFSADFLLLAFGNFSIAFANEVFLVLTRDGANEAGVAQDHLSIVPVIVNWARNGASTKTLAMVPAHWPFAMSRAELLRKMGRLIASDLVKPLGSTGELAVAETAAPFNDTEWYWIDDAAKVAELFCHPVLAATEPDLAERLIDTIVDCSQLGFVHRRVGAPFVAVRSADPRNFEVANSFSVFSGDLWAGTVNQGVRFNDGRTRTLVTHVPGELRFSWEGNTYSTDLRSTIFDCSIIHDGDKVVLRHFSTIRKPGNHMRELAVAEWAYTIDPTRNALGVRLKVQPSGFASIRDIEIRTSLVELSRFTEIATNNGDSWQTRTLEHTASDVSDDGESPAIEPFMLGVEFLSLVQKGSQPEHAMAIHVGSLGSQVDVLRSDHFQQKASNSQNPTNAVLVHRSKEGARRRSAVVIREDRLLTSGGYYDNPDDYRSLTLQPAKDGWLRDPSMSYDIGAELNAVATYLFFAHRQTDQPSPQKNGKLTKYHRWYERHLAHYMKRLEGEDQPHNIFVRGLSFALLSLDTMRRTFDSDDYGRKLQRLMQILLGTELAVRGKERASIFSSTRSHDAHPELDSHGAAILALARAAFAFELASQDRRLLSGAIARGIRAIEIGTPDTAAFGNRPMNHPTLVLAAKPGAANEDSGYWTYKLGIALRALHGVRDAADAGRIVLATSDMQHLEKLVDVAKRALAQAAIARETAIEMLTSVDSGETNSETQPWVAAGLVPAIDREILGLETADWIEASMD